jgi:uncharacterized protein (DUF1697 family)
MAELRECLTSLGLSDVTTYLQTGNVAFESNQPAEKLKPLIEKALGERFNYQAFVLIYPASILESAVRGYPFATDDHTHRYAIFCANSEVMNELMSHRSELDHTIEDIAPGKQVAYWRVPKGSTLDTTFSKLLAKPQYKSTTTNRNLNTLEKMCDLPL